MPEPCLESDTLRIALLPLAPAILRCFAQGLTVEQCAAYLKFVPSGTEHPLLDRLESPEGYRAIRAIFWAHQEKNPKGLFQSLVGGAIHQFSDWEAVARFILASRPYLFSWLPEAHRRKVEEALGAPVGGDLVI